MGSAPKQRGIEHRDSMVLAGNVASAKINIDELTHDERLDLITTKKTYALVLLVTGLLIVCACAGGLWKVLGPGGAIGVGLALGLGCFIGAGMLFQYVAKIEEIDVLSQSLHQTAQIPTTDDEILKAAGMDDDSRSNDGGDGDDDAVVDKYAHEDEETRRIRAEIKAGAANYHNSGGLDSLLLLICCKFNEEEVHLDEMSSVKLALLFDQKHQLARALLVIGVIVLVALTGALWTTIGPGAIGVGIVGSAGFFIWSRFMFQQAKKIKEVNTLSQSFHNKNMGEEFFKEHVDLPDIDDDNDDDGNNDDVEMGHGRGVNGDGDGINPDTVSELSSEDTKTKKDTGSASSKIAAITASEKVLCEKNSDMNISDEEEHIIKKSSSRNKIITVPTAVACTVDFPNADGGNSNKAKKVKTEEELDYERKLKEAETAMAAAEQDKTKFKEAKKAIAAAEEAQQKVVLASKKKKKHNNEATKYGGGT